MRGRRLLPALLLLLGAAALVSGFVTLQRIFLRERDVSVSGLAVRRRALDQYALQAFAEALSGRLSAVERQIDSARRDPLVPGQDLLLVVGGRTVLPRRAPHLPGLASPARTLLLELRGGRSPRAEAGSPLAERSALFRRLSEMLAKEDRNGIEDAFRSLLAHRMLFVLPAHEDLPFAIAALEALRERSQPRVDLQRGLLRDGLSDGRGGEMPGLQRALLAKRERLGKSDFEFLADRIRQLSAASGTLHDDFDARVTEPAGDEVEVPAGLKEPSVVANVRWYVEPRPDGTVRGVGVPRGGLLAEVSARMNRHGLLPSDGRLVLANAAPSVPVSHLFVRVESQSFEAELAQARRNYRTKSGWAVFCALLTGLLALLGVLWIRQERRYVDLKADFVATVSHELRTPLSSVRLLAETLERRLGADPDGRGYPARIVREADRLGFLVENILSFNRISQGKVRPDLSDVNLGEILGNVHGDRGEGRDVVLSMDGVSETWLRADSELLYLLFSNLYENAWRYSSRRPVRIRVEAKRNGGRVDLEFSDNGDGLPPGTGDRVFRDYFRASEARGQSRQGSGLGLAICRKVVGLHGGTIRIVESGPGGTTFGMSLPLP
jgi:signal transduction histidine kinase